MNSEIQTIAFTRSPYKQKFAIPRQAGLVSEIEGEIVFNKEFSDPNILRGIEEFSHLWLLFLFHANPDRAWSATVQPPRLGGTKKMGVFATRSPFRPSPIGMSVVENLGHKQLDSKLILKVGGLDLLDGTPIVDIKPYLPYADSIPQAEAGYARQAPGRDFMLEFSETAAQQLNDLQDNLPKLKQAITAVLSQDPRPAWRSRHDDDKPDDREYGMSLYDQNIKWQLRDGKILILSIDSQTC